MRRSVAYIVSGSSSSIRAEMGDNWWQQWVPRGANPDETLISPPVEVLPLTQRLSATASAGTAALGVTRAQTAPGTQRM
jgi:hypothetical protein